MSLPKCRTCGAEGCLMHAQPGRSTPTPPSALVQQIKQATDDALSEFHGQTGRHEGPLVDLLVAHVGKLFARALSERDEELGREGKRGDRREAEMAEQRDLAYAKYDKAEAHLREREREVERLREVVRWAARHQSRDCDCPALAQLATDALLGRRPAPEST